MDFDASLGSLPDPSEKRMALRVSSAALRELRRGHPWLFDQSIERQSFDGRAGDLAVVFDSDRQFAAIGLYDPASAIRVRMLQHRKPATIDRSFWRSAITNAVQTRQSLQEGGETTGYRLVNGENDGLPGFILDRFEATIVCKLYSAAWLPHLQDVLSQLDAETVGFEPSNIVLRLARQVERGETHGLRDGQVLAGEPSEPQLFLENGLRFESHPISGQKTGHFLDQRDNRRRVAARSEGCRVLDVFSCTGGFSVHAAAAGATHVHSVDLNPWAVETVSRNLALNAEATAGCEHRATIGDAFRVMEDLVAAGERYDIVVVDPPSFAMKQADVGRARRAYSRLTELALPLVSNNGLLMQASCSSRLPAEEFSELVDQTADRAGYLLTDTQRTGHAIDHPIGFPEGAYLKAVFATVESGL